MQPATLIVLLLLLQAYRPVQGSNPMSESSNRSEPMPSEQFNVTSNQRPEVDFNLSDNQWQHRLVLVFTPSEALPAYQQQMQAWKTQSEGFQDRDLKLVVVSETGQSQVDEQLLSPASAQRLRQQFGILNEQFRVILIGKDGTEKQRSQTPIDPALLFQTIDAMPMRQQEMRAQP